MCIRDRHIPFDMRRVRQLHNADLETVDTTPLTKEEAYGLFVQWLQLKDMAARDRIFFSMTQLVQQLAHDLEKQDKLDCELEDAISEGYLVILEKLHSWNPDIAQFSTHSYERARGAMQPEPARAQARPYRGCPCERCSVLGAILAR